MALEPGGYADKLGNRYEGRWVVKQLLRLLDEKITSVVIESVGNDEEGVDLWIEDLSGHRNAQQCKLRNQDSNQWSISNLKSAGILNYIQKQLDRDPNFTFSLVSAVSSITLHDMCVSARNSSGDPESFYQSQIINISKNREKAFNQFCKALSLDTNIPADKAKAFNYLSRIHIEVWPDTLSSENDLKDAAQWLINGDPVSIIASIADFAETHIRKIITPSDISNYLFKSGFSLRNLEHDERVLPNIRKLKTLFDESVAGSLIAEKLIFREETKEIIDALKTEDVILLSGRPGGGKSSILYELTQYFNNIGHTYLPLRLDRQIPENTTQNYGQNLGLPESPVRCLNAISGDASCTLILDQLDAIRWTYGHSKNALDVCKLLVDEVKRLRRAGKKISIILSCRAYDLENDPDISTWLKRNTPPIKKINVSPLPREIILKITTEYTKSHLSDKQITILSSPQHLAMWVKLYEGGQQVEFKNSIQLLREYWHYLLQELHTHNISKGDIELELSNIVSYMERKGKISAPYSIHRDPIIIDALCACGLIQKASNKITFSHQSYLDYQIANNLVREIFRNNKGICEWLGDKSKQSLYRREQLRQALGLLSEESPEDFLSEIKLVLNNSNVRFHLKHLILEVVGQVDSPDSDLITYILDLIQNPEWKEHVLFTVLLNHPAYVEHLSNLGLLDKWLFSAELRDDALRILRSVSKSLSDLVTKHLTPYVDDENWHKTILQCLNYDLADDSDKMFDLRLQLARKGTINKMFTWKKVPSKRSISLLQAVLQSYEPKDFTYDIHLKFGNSQSRIESWSYDDFELLKKNALEKAQDTWIYLIPEIERLAPYYDDSYGVMELWIDSGTNSYRQGYETLPNGVVKLCIEAGVVLASKNSDEFWRNTQSIQSTNSFVINYILCSVYKSLDISFADRVIKWLMGTYPDFIYGTAESRPKWVPSANIIKDFSPYCSDELYSKLEVSIIYLKEFDLLNRAKRVLPLRKEGYFHSYWGEAQYFLLPALAEFRRSKQAHELINVLIRKYEKCNEDIFTTGLKINGGLVTSSIPRERLNRISNRAWLKIISNKKIPEKSGLKWDNYKDGRVSDASIYYFSIDLEFIARRNPQRFAQLALSFPDDVHSQYKSAILKALQELDPNELTEEEKENWEPVENQLILKVLAKFNDESDDAFPLEFCRLIQKRANTKWPINIIDRLILYATTHEDPKQNQLIIGNPDHGFDVDKSTPSNLESNAINCVRGVAVHTIAQLLWTDESLYEKFKPILKLIADDAHPVVRAALVHVLLPLANIDKNFAVELFIQASRNDYRVASTHCATRFFNACMKDYYEELYPLIISMLNSATEEVVMQASQEIIARWIFYGYFSEEVERCVTGGVPQRKAVARIVSSLIHKATYFDKCKSLINRLFNDGDKDVRHEASKLNFSELFSSNKGTDLLLVFINSNTFKDDPTFLLHDLIKFTGNILPFSDIIITIGKKIFELTKGLEYSDVYYDTHIYFPLIVRLYEQASDVNKTSIESDCLDIFDGMYQYRVGHFDELSQLIG